MGVYWRDPDRMSAFVELGTPTDDELHALLQTLSTRTMELLTRWVVIVKVMGQTYLAEPDTDGDLARRARTSCNACANASNSGRCSYSSSCCRPARWGKSGTGKHHERHGRREAARLINIKFQAAGASHTGASQCACVQGRGVVAELRPSPAPRLKTLSPQCGGIALWVFQHLHSSLSPDRRHR